MQGCGADHRLPDRPRRLRRLFQGARGRLPGNPPASATVQVAGLLVNARLEIDAVAVIKTKRVAERRRGIGRSQGVMAMQQHRRDLSRAHAGLRRAPGAGAQQPARRRSRGISAIFRPIPSSISAARAPISGMSTAIAMSICNYNGLSLIHGHAFPPGGRGAGPRSAPDGWAWLGTSRPQIEFAETLRGRIKTFERVLFTNSGTEAGMLAVKLARGFTASVARRSRRAAAITAPIAISRPGLHGQGEIPGHTLLAEFNDIESFERVLERHGREIAAVVLEPVMYTGVVMPALPGFLKRVQETAHRAGALFVLDDCLMFRLAPRRFGREVRARRPTSPSSASSWAAACRSARSAAGPRSWTRRTRARREGRLSRRLVQRQRAGSVAGRITVEHLTPERIARWTRLPTG